MLVPGFRPAPTPPYHFYTTETSKNLTSDADDGSGEGMTLALGPVYTSHVTSHTDYLRHPSHGGGRGARGKRNSPSERG